MKESVLMLASVSVHCLYFYTLQHTLLVCPGSHVSCLPKFNSNYNVMYDNYIIIRFKSVLKQQVRGMKL